MLAIACRNEMCSCCQSSSQDCVIIRVVAGSWDRSRLDNLTQGRIADEKVFSIQVVRCQAVDELFALNHGAQFFKQRLATIQFNVLISSG